MLRSADMQIADTATNETGFIVQRFMSPSWEDFLVDEEDRLDPCSDTGTCTYRLALEANETYRLRVCAVNHENERSDYAEAAPFTTKDFEINQFEFVDGKYDSVAQIAMANDGSGNLYMAGKSSDLSGGFADIYVAKFNSHGEIIDQASWGLSGREEKATGIAVNSDGSEIFVSGTANIGGEDTDIAILKFNPNLTLADETIINTPQNDNATGLIVDNQDDSRLFVVADSYGDLAGNGLPNEEDIFLLILNTSTLATMNVIQCPEEESDGHDTGGSIAINADGIVYIAATKTIVGSYEEDGFILRINPDTEDVDWNFMDYDTDSGIPSYPDTNEWVHAIAVAPDGSVYVTGQFHNYPSGPNDIFLYKWNAELTIIDWVEAIDVQDVAGGVPGHDNGADVIVDSQGFVYVLADVQVPPDNADNRHKDLEVFKFTAGGNFAGGWNIGHSRISSIGALDDYASSFAINEFDEIYIGAQTKGEFYEGINGNPQDSDAVLLRMDIDGNFHE